jgi:hypothetical protein
MPASAPNPTATNRIALTGWNERAAKSSSRAGQLIRPAPGCATQQARSQGQRDTGPMQNRDLQALGKAQTEDPSG